MTTSTLPPAPALLGPCDPCRFARAGHRAERCAVEQRGTVCDCDCRERAVRGTVAHQAAAMATARTASVLAQTALDVPGQLDLFAS